MITPAPTAAGPARRSMPSIAISRLAQAAAARQRPCSRLCTSGPGRRNGGSIQSPSSAQSLVGIKPTFALVPTAAWWPLAGSTRDVAGPIATNVRDAALMLDVLAGFFAARPKTIASRDTFPKMVHQSAAKGCAARQAYRLYGHGWNLLDLSSETRSLYERAVSELEAQGAILVQDPFAGSGLPSWPCQTWV